MIGFILNLPWTLLQLIISFFLLPKHLEIQKHPFAIIITVRSMWVYEHVFLKKGARAAAWGVIVILGPRLEKYDLEHELIHIEQYQREPFVHPFLYIYESFKRGSRQNKYEQEAYRRAGNVYKDV